jgi:restriction system protein
MNGLSPTPPSRTNGVRAIFTGILIAATSLGAGFGSVWVLILLIRTIVDFVITYRAWILAVVIVSLVAFVARATIRAAAVHEAELTEQRLKEIANLERVDAMSGPQFEELVAELLRRDGYFDVAVVGRSGDQGVDITARAHNRCMIAVQCKRQGRNVPADRVRNLIGAVHSAYTGHQGVLVTNQDYTQPAYHEGEGRITMIGRQQLGTWMAGEPLDLDIR